MQEKITKSSRLPSFPKVIEIDSLDRKILSILQKDAKTPLRRIQDMLKTSDDQKPSTSTIKAHIDNLVEKGIIEDFIAVVNCNRIGYREMFHFYIQIKPEVKINDVVDELLEIHELNVINIMAGEDPIFCIAKCVDKPQQITLLERLNQVKGIEKIRTQVVLQRIKEDMRVSIPEEC